MHCKRLQLHKYVKEISETEKQISETEKHISETEKYISETENDSSRLTTNLVTFKYRQTLLPIQVEV